MKNHIYLNPVPRAGVILSVEGRKPIMHCPVRSYATMRGVRAAPSAPATIHTMTAAMIATIT